jgi:hypothetical protein
MSGFGEREKDFENKYAYEEKMGFKIDARATKLFGLWAAEKLGLSDADAAAYAIEVVSAKLESAGFEGALKKVGSDLSKKSIDISNHLLQAELDKCREEAREQVQNEVK